MGTVHCPLFLSPLHCVLDDHPLSAEGMTTASVCVCVCVCVFMCTIVCILEHVKNCTKLHEVGALLGLIVKCWGYRGRRLEFQQKDSWKASWRQQPGTLLMRMWHSDNP